jgi:hypothetical protein
MNRTPWGREQKQGKENQSHRVYPDVAERHHDDPAFRDDVEAFCGLQFPAGLRLMA